ncbi:MAG: hypothetical protein HFJ94_05025 [Muribaculaceae bacterium]|nr:hypothetical protein [Muribaculaceae bacterium]
MRKFGFVLAACAMFALGYFAGAKKRSTEICEVQVVKVDTVMMRDTVIITEPVLKSGYRAGRTAVTVARAELKIDSAECGDSVDIELPRVVRRYSGDEYDAYVSGISPRLDSLVIYKEWPEVSRTVIQPPGRHSRWSVGVGAGVSATPCGIRPYIGIGVSYRLFSF